MTYRANTVRKVLAVLLAVALPGGAALAQESGEAGEVREIIVEAPRSAALRVERSPYTGAAIVTSTARIPVFYHDLDLTRAGDGERLMTRVARVAQDVCRELDRLLPFEPDGDCVRRAIASGTEAANAAIARARAGQ
jgi:UrcA family protein